MIRIILIVVLAFVCYSLMGYAFSPPDWHNPTPAPTWCNVCAPPAVPGFDSTPTPEP